MQLILEILTGPLAGKKTWIRQGQTFKIGRTEAADYALPHDSTMSGVHFSAECLSNGCRIRDLKSRNGTFVNGQKIEEASVQNGDEVSAGKSRFRIQLERDPADVLEGFPAPPIVSSPPKPAAPVVHQPPPVKAPREVSASPPVVPPNRPQPPAPPRPVPPAPPLERQPGRSPVTPSQDPWEQQRPAPPPQVEQPPARPRPKEPVANQPPVVPPSPPVPPAPIPTQAPPLFGRRVPNPDVRTSDPFADVPQLPADDFRITNPNAGRRPIDPEADWGEPTLADPWAGAPPPPPAVPSLGEWRDFLGGPGGSEPDLSDDWLEKSQDDLWSAAAAARHPEGESSEKTPPTDAWGELRPLPAPENPVQGDPSQAGPSQRAPLQGGDSGAQPPEVRDDPRQVQDAAPSPPPSPLEWGDLQNQPVDTHDSSPTLPPPYEPLTPFAPSRESPAPMPSTPSAPEDYWQEWNAGGATAPPRSDAASFNPVTADEERHDAGPRPSDAPAPPVAADDWSGGSNGEWPDAAGSTLDAGPTGWVNPDAAPPAIQRGPVAQQAPAAGIVGSPEPKAGGTSSGRAHAKSTDRSKNASVGDERPTPAGAVASPAPAPPRATSPTSASDAADDSEDDMLVLSHVKSAVPIRKTATINPAASDQASNAARPSAAGSKPSSAPTVPPRSSDPRIRTSSAGVGSGPARAPAARESAGKDSQRSKVNTPSNPPAVSPKSSRKPDTEVKVIDFAKYTTVQGNRLYAVVDRALKPELVSLAHKLELPFECLRPGELTPQVSRVSPFLIEVGSSSIFLAKWGNELGTDAGVLMESPSDFKAVMKHYREMYMFPDADGIESTFRFFDPKEVRRQVSDSTPAKLAAFFGPVTVLVAESEDPAILDRYVFGPSGLFWTRLRVQGS